MQSKFGILLGNVLEKNSILPHKIKILQAHSTLLLQHHGVINSEYLDLAFIAFWNQTLHMDILIIFLGHEVP
jgi:hypothetical protein